MWVVGGVLGQSIGGGGVGAQARLIARVRRKSSCEGWGVCGWLVSLVERGPWRSRVREADECRVRDMGLSAGGGWRIWGDVWGVGAGRGGGAEDGRWVLFVWVGCECVCLLFCVIRGGGVRDCFAQ